MYWYLSPAQWPTSQLLSFDDNQNKLKYAEREREREREIERERERVGQAHDLPHQQQVPGCANDGNVN